MDSDLNSIKNQLIIYKTNGKLPNDIVIQIQELLLNGKKLEEFESMLKKVEKLIK
jgi:hypothetical protein